MASAIANTRSIGTLTGTANAKVTGTTGNATSNSTAAKSRFGVDAKPREYRRKLVWQSGEFAGCVRGIWCRHGLPSASVQALIVNAEVSPLVHAALASTNSHDAASLGTLKGAVDLTLTYKLVANVPEGAGISYVVAEAPVIGGSYHAADMAIAVAALNQRYLHVDNGTSGTQALRLRGLRPAQVAKRVESQTRR